MRVLSIIVVSTVAGCASAPSQPASVACADVCTVMVSNDGNAAVDVWTGGFAPSPSAQFVGTVGAGGRLQVVRAEPPRLVSMSYRTANGGENRSPCRFVSRSSDVLRFDCSARVSNPPPAK